MERESRVRLSATQLRAIDGELRGLTSSEIGHEVGVAAGTIRNWRSHHRGYQHELHRRLHELGERHRMQELRIGRKVLDVIERALDEGDVSVATRIHRTYSAVGRRPAEGTDPALLWRLEEAMGMPHGGRPVWARDALKAYRAAELALRFVESEDPPLGEIARLGLLGLIALTTALDESEGEGPRALIPTPGAWQRKHFPAARRLAEAPIPSLPDDPLATGWASIGTREVLAVYQRMAQVSHVICTAFVGPERSPPLPEPFVGHLETLESCATGIDEFVRSWDGERAVPDVLGLGPPMVGAVAALFLEWITDEEEEE